MDFWRIKKYELGFGVNWYFRYRRDANLLANVECVLALDTVADFLGLTNGGYRDVVQIFVNKKQSNRRNRTDSGAIIGEPWVWKTEWISMHHSKSDDYWYSGAKWWWADYHRKSGKLLCGAQWELWWTWYARAFAGEIWKVSGLGIGILWRIDDACGFDGIFVQSNGRTVKCRYTDCL